MTGSFFTLNATLAVELFVFAVVLVVLARFVIGPLQAAMRRRQAEIEESMAKARRVEELLAAAETDYQATLGRARQEARRIIETAQQMADHTLTHRAGQEGPASGISSAEPRVRRTHFSASTAKKTTLEATNTVASSPGPR